MQMFRGRQRDCDTNHTPIKAALASTAPLQQSICLGKNKGEFVLNPLIQSITEAIERGAYCGLN